MTRREALADINALPHVSATYDRDWGEFRITLQFRGAGLSLKERMARQEAVAAYTECAHDALCTARAMSEQEERRLQSEAR